MVESREERIRRRLRCKWKMKNRVSVKDLSIARRYWKWVTQVSSAPGKVR